MDRIRRKALRCTRLVQRLVYLGFAVAAMASPTGLLQADFSPLPETVNADALRKRAQGDAAFLPAAREAAEIALRKVVMVRSRVCELRTSFHRRHTGEPERVPNDSLLAIAGECDLVAKIHAEPILGLKSCPERVEAMRLAWCGYMASGHAGPARMTVELTVRELHQWTNDIGLDQDKIRTAIAPHAKLVFDVLLGHSIELDYSRQYAKALQSARLAEGVALEYLRNEPQASASCLDTIGLILVRLGQLPAALESFRKSLEFVNQLNPPDAWQVIDRRAKIIQTLTRLQDLKALRDETIRLAGTLDKVATREARIPSVELHSHSLVIDGCLITDGNPALANASVREIDALSVLRKGSELSFTEQLSVIDGRLAVARWKASIKDVRGSLEAIEDAVRRLKTVRDGAARMENGDDLLADYDFLIGLAYAANGKNGRAAECFDQHRQREWRRNIDRLVCVPLYEQYLINAIDISPRINLAMNLAWDAPDESQIVELTATWLLNSRQLLGTALEKQIGKTVALPMANPRPMEAPPIDPAVPPAALRVGEIPLGVPVIEARSFGLRPAKPLAAAAEPKVVAERAAEQAAASQWFAREAFQAWRAAQLWQGAEAENSPEWLSLRQVQRKLRADDVLVLYARVDRARSVLNKTVLNKTIADDARYGAWIIHPDTGGAAPKPRFVDLGSAQAIDQSIREWQAEIPRFYKQTDSAMDLDQRAQTSLKALADLVLAPLRLDAARSGAEIKCLRVLPDSMLWMAPFAALPFQGKQFLVEAVEVELLRSGHQFFSVHEENVDWSPAVMFGDPDFQAGLLAAQPVAGGAEAAVTDRLLASPATSNVAALRVEPLRFGKLDSAVVGKALQTHFGDDAVILTGKSASESALRSVRSPYAMIVSTHGYYLSGKASNGNPDQLVGQQLELAANGELSQHPWMRSGFTLAGFSRLNNAGGRNHRLPADNDGNVTAHDVLRLNLKGTRLVVLSACSTGIGDTQTGESVAGLWQAFHIAGAREVVATLWDIPDVKLTSDFVAEFLALHAQPATASSALRTVQLDTIKKRRETNQSVHPVFWAGFVSTSR